MYMNALTFYLRSCFLTGMLLILSGCFGSVPTAITPGKPVTDESVPLLSVEAVDAPEGSNLVFNLSLNSPSEENVVLVWKTDVAGNASFSDAVFSMGNTLFFSPGETTKQITVVTNQDTLFEQDEKVAFHITSLLGASSAELVYTALIIDDDTMPNISIADVTVDEGDTASVTVSIDAISGADVSFDWATADHSATAGSDYTVNSGSNIIIPAGLTQTTLTIPTIDDNPAISDDGEVFRVNITNVSGANALDLSSNVTLTENLSLRLLPSTVHLEGGTSYQFEAAGGNMPYTFSIVSGGGSIDANGLYTSAVANETVTVRVTDNNSSTAQAIVEVRASHIPTLFATCGNLSASSPIGRLYDSGGPSGNYSPNETCYYNPYSYISSNSMILYFDQFDLGAGDEIVISEWEGPEIARFSNASPPPSSFDTGTNDIEVEFFSDASGEAGGYDIRWEIDGLVFGDGPLNHRRISQTPQDWVEAWEFEEFIQATGGQAPYSFEILSGPGVLTDVTSSDYSTKINSSLSEGIILATSKRLLLGETDTGSVVVRITDAAGTTHDIQYDSVSGSPTVSHLGMGTPRQGASISIYGTNFHPLSQAYLNDQLCDSITVVSPVRLNCVIPMNQEAGQIDVRVTNPQGEGTLENAFSIPVGVWKVLANQPSFSDQRYGLASAFTGRHQLYWGGSNGSSSYGLGNFNNGFKYDVSSESWSSLSSGGLSQRTGSQHTWTGSEFIIYSGIRNTNDSPTNGAAYNPITNTWRSLASPIYTDFQSGRKGVWTGKEFILTGGYWGSDTTQAQAYNPTTNTWRALANMPGSTSLHDIIWTGDRVIVWSGGFNQGKANGYSYNPATNSWTTIALSPLRGATGNHYNVESSYLKWTGDRMLVVGGNRYNSGDFIGSYNPATDTWESISQTSFASSWFSRLIWNGLELVYLHNSAIRKYNQKNDTWSSMNAPNAVRANASAVMNTGSSITLCFGALITSNHCEDLEDYSPDNKMVSQAKNTWREMASIGGPSARSGHSMTWTGKYLIVFGGETSSGVTQSGYRYDPFVDEWTVLSSTNAPSARKNHRAHWMGSKLIVWGGESDSSVLGDGAIYDPQTDTWTPMPSLNAPSARVDFASTRIDHRLIVWGGFDGSANLDSGAIYDSNANTWTAMSQTNVISARRSAKAVYNGENVFLFGGDSQQGGIYNPDTDSWSNMSLVNAPAARTGHSFVIAAHKLLVWGGSVAGIASNSGALYDYTTDTWEPLTGALPTARKNHVSIWTGNFLMIYGGESDTGALANGEAFDPHNESVSLFETQGEHEAGITNAVWIGHIGWKSRFGYRNNHTGDTPGLIFFGGKDSTGNSHSTGSIFMPTEF